MSQARVRITLALLTVSLLAFGAWVFQGWQQAVPQVTARDVPPAGGHHSMVGLGDSVSRAVSAGVLDPHKLAALYARRGGIPRELSILLEKPAYRRILLTEGNAGLYVNILWPLGLANRLEANRASPLNGPALMSYASTGGWTLGKAPNGGAYFNKYPIVKLSRRQEALVAEIAEHTFRPCCNNSTFFQDCNHGSALLGLLALGASQGLSEKELYSEALAFNSFWFPEQYRLTALYFETVRKLAWDQVDARQVMSAAYSSAEGWRRNVAAELSNRGLAPAQGGSNCSA